MAEEKKDALNDMVGDEVAARRPQTEAVGQAHTSRPTTSRTGRDARGVSLRSFRPVSAQSEEAKWSA